MSRNPGFHIGWALALTMLLVSACSSGSNPAMGPITNPDDGLTTRGLVGYDGSRPLWGYWHITVDPTTSNVDILPLRGVMMHVNAVEWMQPPGGSLANLGVVIVDDSLFLSEGRMDLDVSLTHPFAGLDMFTGFDVMGVYMTDGHQTLNYDATVTISDDGDLDSTLLNEDGYTRWWNQLEFNGSTPRIFSYIPGAVATNGFGICEATLNPYKYFAHGITATEDDADYAAANSAYRGYFGAGETITRRYEIKWSMTPTLQFEFDYAVVASWEEALDDPPAVPDDFPFNANALEPIALSVTDNSDLYYDETTDTYGGNFTAELEVYSWQGMDPLQSIPSTISQIVLEFPGSPAIPGGSYTTQNSSTWVVNNGLVNSSVWSVDIAGLAPAAMGSTTVLIIFETVNDYDNGFGSPYPVGEALSSYFMIETEVYGTPGVPTCESPVPEHTSRNYLDLEEFTSIFAAPGGTSYNSDWSVEPVGNPYQWVNVDSDIINVNWYTASNNGTSLGTYDVCVSVYSTEGFNMCCTSVVVDDIATLGPVTGQNDILPPQQPDQGAEPCDITIWDTGSGSIPQILYQDSGLAEDRIYRFNDTYSTVLGTSTLDTTGFPAPLDDATSWEDYHKFDVRPSSQVLFITSANDTFPSIADPNSYNINDPYHAWVLPYWNMTGSNIMIGLYGDVGYNPTPPSPPDPDAVPWKHMVDWTSGALNFEGRFHGLMTVSEEWLPEHPTYSHPGTIWAVTSWPAYNDFDDYYYPFGLGGMSSQYSVPGEIDDTDPGFMALAVDDDVPYQEDFSSAPTEHLSDVVVWYMLSSEATGSNRKVHISLLPEDVDDPGYMAGVDIFYYDDYIGTGSYWALDFGTSTPIDLEVLNANDPDAGLSNTYNWLAVLLDSGAGWTVNVYRYDPLFGTLVLVDSYNDAGVYGDPTALDIDTEEWEIHVLYDNAGTYRVTVLEFT